MIKNYLNTAIRFLRHNKVFAAINMMGLSIALSVSFIILLFVINELSYDHFNKNRKQVFRVLNYYEDFNNIMAGTPYVLATALKEEFPQIEKAATERYMRGFKLKQKDEFVNVPETMATNPDLFDIFTLPLIMGSSKKNLLEDQNSLVLSGELAEKFFPGQNPIGKEITGFANNEEHVFIITGVFKNIPENSTLKAQCFINSKWTIEPINKAFGITNAEKSWTHDFWTTWVLISKGTNVKSLENQFKSI